MQPKVTIVIPVYNGENYLKEAIDSALAQSYGNIEVIVVNDGSSDRSEEIALTYGDRIRYFYKENGGVSTALNVGIAHMTGTYFQYLPHDDLLAPDKIKLQIEAIQESGDEMPIAWSGWSWLEEPAHKLVPFQIPPWYPKSRWMVGTYPLYFGIVNTVTVLLHRDYFTQMGTFDETLYTSQDYDMWYRTFQGRRTVYVDEPLVCYRKHVLQGSQGDEHYRNNCMELSLQRVENITQEEHDQIFPSRYKFFYEMMKFYQEQQWDAPLQHIKEQFQGTAEPENAAADRASFLEQLCAGRQQIILYGAGKNGARLQKELWMYGIEVSAFCDTDPAKTGRLINGVPCVSKAALLHSEAAVIITIDAPDAVREELLSQGAECVTDYRETAEKLWTLCPLKERVLHRI